MKRPFLAMICAAAGVALADSGSAVTFPGPGIELAGRVYHPPGKGPFPAIVLLHGCSGLWRRDVKEPSANHVFWAEHFRTRGYVALLVDSFGPRGEREICTQKNRPITPDRDRPLDAYAGLRWLAGQPGVDAARIHVMGWSNGAMTVLNTVKSDAPGWRPQGPQFRSAVAFYPGCAAVDRAAAYRTIAPLLIQTGGADDWTPASHCESLVEKRKGAGASMEIDVYPGAHHGFDWPNSAVRVRPEVRNAASPTGWGASVGSHPEARAKAIQRTTEWLEARNK